MGIVSINAHDMTKICVSEILQSGGTSWREVDVYDGPDRRVNITVFAKPGGDVEMVVPDALQAEEKEAAPPGKEEPE